MSNVMAMDAARSLDTVHTIDICWLVGDEHSVGKQSSNISCILRLGPV